MSFGKDTKIKYWNHQQRAKRKGISFELSLEEWYDIWQQSGHWHERGPRKGQYVMSRFNDTGPYAKDNVYIQTNGDNTREAFTTNNKDFIKPKHGEENHFFGKKHTEETKQKIRIKRALQVNGYSEESVNK